MATAPVAIVIYFGEDHKMVKNIIKELDGKKIRIQFWWCDAVEAIFRTFKRWDILHKCLVIANQLKEWMYHTYQDVDNWQKVKAAE